MINQRSRHFTTVVYPESAPVDWLTYLDQVTSTYIVSPLHDKDSLPDGSLKKPHYHVVLCFSTLKSFSQILELVKSFGGVGAQIVHDLPSMARYLCHLDSKESSKAKYSTDDVLAQNIDFKELIESGSEKAKISDILKIIDRHDILLFSDLVFYARYSPKNLDLVVKHTNFFYRYLQSRGWKALKPSLSRTPDISSKPPLASSREDPLSSSDSSKPVDL